MDKKLTLEDVSGDSVKLLIKERGELRAEIAQLKADAQLMREAVVKYHQAYTTAVMLWRRGLNK